MKQQDETISVPNKSLDKPGEIFFFGLFYYTPAFIIQLVTGPTRMHTNLLTHVHTHTHTTHTTRFSIFHIPQPFITSIVCSRVTLSLPRSLKKKMRKNFICDTGTKPAYRVCIEKGPRCDTGNGKKRATEKRWRSMRSFIKLSENEETRELCSSH